MNPWEERELSLEHRRSKQLLSALHGLPLYVDGETKSEKKKVWGVWMQTTTEIWKQMTEKSNLWFAHSEVEI